MADFIPFNGDSQPVFNMDVHNGSQTGAISSDALVQMDGPKLDFFKLVVENVSNSAQDLRSELGLYSAGVFDPGIVNDLTQAVQQVLNSNQKTILLVIYNSQNQRRYIGVKLD